MSALGGWDVLVCLDEKAIDRLAQDNWNRKEVQELIGKLAEGYSKMLALDPTGLRLEFRAFIRPENLEQRGVPFLIELETLTRSEMRLRFTLQFIVHVKIRMLLGGESDRYVDSGTFMETAVRVHAAIEVTSSHEEIGTENEHIAFVFRDFSPDIRFVDSPDQSQGRIADFVRNISRPYLRKLLKGRSFAITPLYRRFVVAGGEIDRPGGEISQEDIQVSFAFRKMRNLSSVLVGASFVVPHDDSPFLRDRPPLTDLYNLGGLLEMRDGSHMATGSSQRVFTYLQKYLTQGLGRKAWAGALHHEPHEDGMYRLAPGPDFLTDSHSPNRTIVVDNSDDDTISLDRVNEVSINSDGFFTEFHMHICKSGFLFFGRPDPDFNIGLRGRIGPKDDDASQLEVKHLRIPYVESTDGIVESIGQALWAPVDFAKGLYNLLQGDLDGAGLNGIFVLQSIFSPAVALMPFIPLFNLVKPKDASVLKKFEIAWQKDHAATSFTYDADATAYDTNSDNPALVIHLRPQGLA